MDIKDIEKKLKEFQATMTPAEKPAAMKKPTKQEKAAAGPPPFAGVKEVGIYGSTQPQPVAEEAVPTASPCFTQAFKGLLVGLKTDYIGQNQAESMLLEFINQVPECEAS